ncbi:amino acid adenylation domain-containing protein [Cysteiniphilum litorale]|uniref:amino acid adenylation domain-containing protein n=1 Tax=Cysteiniphilum litorale TaxID=2056700 RepID=UPI003F8806D2
MTQLVYRRKLSSLRGDCDCVLVDDQAIYANGNREKLSLNVKPTDLMYVMYTSGTTGQPKGVMIEHRSVINTVYSLFEVYCLTSQSRVTTYAAFSFDVFVSEVWVTLLQGALLYIIPENIRRNMVRLAEYFEHHLIEYAFIPPAVLSLLPRDRRYQFKSIVVAGETCSEDSAQYWSKCCQLYNYYGPTEASIYASGKLVSDGYAVINSIGSPISNTKLYVLDENLNIQPIGAVGELYISGIGLARGYLNNEKLTKERFIDNPFAPKSGLSCGYAKLYKTGDLCRFLPDGEIEYVGRSDTQVKINGMRVELGEIESALGKLEGVNKCVVVIKKDSQNKATSQQNLPAMLIIACYAADTAIKEDIIRNHLAYMLPQYMLPNVYVHLKNFPISANGKTDRKALLDEITINDIGAKERLLPENDVHQELRKIWSDILGVAIDEIGIDDSFYAYGGNSINAVDMSVKINRILAVDISPSVIMNMGTIKKIAAELISHQLKNHLNRKSSDEVCDLFDGDGDKYCGFPLSREQQGIYLAEQYNESAVAIYNIPMLLKLTDKVIFHYMERALREVIKRHDILSCCIEQQLASSELRQSQIDIDWSIRKYQCANQAEFRCKMTEIASMTLMGSDKLPFSVSMFSVGSGYLSRFMHGVEDSQMYIFINMHHTVFDGWSIKIFLSELKEAYDALSKEGVLRLAKVVQYRDYVHYQQGYISSDNYSKKLKYWCERLSGYENLNLPLDKPREASINYQGKNVNFTLGARLTDKLRKLAQKEKITVGVLLLGAYYLLLNKYTGSDDIVIGVPMMNRQHTHYTQTIGCFVNMVALREYLDSDLSIGEFIRQIQQSLVEAQMHQDVPLESVIQTLGIEPQLDTHPLFQVVFNMQPFESFQVASDLWDFSIGHDVYSVAKFDLSLLIDDSGNNIHGYFNYATALFKEEKIRQISRHYHNVLRKLVSCPETLIKDLSVLSKKEYEKIVYKWNQTDKPFPKDRTIHQLFEEQVRKTPDNIALVCEADTMSYKELNEKSNQLARFIRGKYHESVGQSLAPDTLIALCLDRSFEMIISIIAVLKAGGAYVPIDPLVPEERLLYVLDDTGCRLLLTQSHLGQVHGYLSHSDKVELVMVDQADIYQGDSDNLNIDIKSSHLIYVMYTSGTTGRPKGVMIEHGGVVNLVYAQQSLAFFGEREAMVQFASYVFDAFVWEIFLVMSFGARLLITRSVLEGRVTFFTFDSEISKVVMLPPSCIDCLSGFGNQRFKFVVVGGEKCSKHVIEQAKKSAEMVFNAYGPTESTVYATMAKGSSVYTGIGKPIQNVKVYILDRQFIPVALGVIGELYIAGAGLARGYLNLAKETRERFINNPFATDLDRKNGFTRLYKTGDLARWLPNGEIEYIGRSDFQVKIRGFRVELSEVESVLNRIDGIDRSVVLTQQDKDNGHIILVAYYGGDAAISEVVIQAHVARYLPEYMRPQGYCYIKSFPLTTNGKLDKKALPKIVMGSRVDHFRAAKGIKRLVCKVYADVLGLKLNMIPFDKSFFELGGNSLMLMQLKNLLAAEVPEAVDLKVSDLFAYPNVDALSRYLQNKENIKRQHKPKVDLYVEQ